MREIDGNEALRVLYEAECRMAPGGGSKRIAKEEEITILIPCYGETRNIKHAIKSCLNQTLKPKKILVLLMDEEACALKSGLEGLSPLIECIKGKGLSPCEGRNYLVKKCETEYFVFLDINDTLSENFLEAVYGEDASIVFPDVTGDDAEKSNIGEGFLFMHCIRRKLTFLLCKTSWEEVGGLDEELSDGGFEDDFVIRLFSNTKWQIQKTFSTSYYQRYNERWGGSKEFYSSCFKLVVKNRELLLSEIKKCVLQDDAFIRFLEDESNFESEEKASESFLSAMEEIEESESENSILNRPVVFGLNKECNRECDYCNQKAEDILYPHYDDDEIFDRFDKLLTKAEELTEGHIKLNIMGGEPTIWSDYLIEKILSRTENYSSIVLLSNRDNRASFWEKDSRVMFYTHLCDWHDAGRIEVKGVEWYMIVLCHSDIEYLEDFLKANSGIKINMEEYIGDDEERKLTDEDREKVAELKEKYCENSSGEESEVKTLEVKSSMEKNSSCVNEVNTWKADCTYMKFQVCCGWYQDLYSLEDFSGQSPDIEGCKKCSFYKEG